jgi:hypothetical protein
VAQSENQAANGENNINIGIDNKSFFLADEDEIVNKGNINIVYRHIILPAGVSCGQHLKHTPRPQDGIFYSRIL